jgi:uncharacterized membrane protein YkvA (DUF1232 family)
MKPKSKSIGPFFNSSKPDTAEFGQVAPDAWRVSGKAMTIDEYIEDQAQAVNSTDLRVLRDVTDRLLHKLIVGVLELPAAQQAKDPLPSWLAEAGFAAGYLLKRYDLIPDHVPEIGLADDALILQRVIERNQSELYRSLVEHTDLKAGDK